MTAGWRFGSTFCLLAGSLTVSVLNDHRKPDPLVHPLSSIEESIDGWSGTDDPPFREAIEASLNATSYLSRTYRRGPATMNLFIAFYERERAGESMHSPKYCLAGGGWEMMDSGMVPVQFGGRTVRINNYLLYKGGEHSRILYWYQGRRRVVADEYFTKLYLVWDALRYGETSGSIVRITLGEQPGALQDGVAFAGQVLQQFGRCFGASQR